MSIFGIAILAGMAAAPVAVAIELFRNQRRTGRFSCSPLPWPNRDRSSQRGEWDAQFPAAAAEVEKVLVATCQALGFHPEDRYKLAPDDRMMDIYRAVYPPHRFCFQADCLEITRLMMELDINPEAMRIEEATLGDLVEFVIRNKSR